MRRVFTLVLLLAGMELLLPLGTAGAGSHVLLAFGFLVLGAQTVGELAALTGLPRIVGYLVAGMAFGPWGLEVVEASAVADLGLVRRLAVAFIAFLAGSELRWADVKRDGGTIVRIMTAELALAFVVLTAAAFVAIPLIPGTAALPPLERAAFAMLFASIAVVHSPAVTMALLSETGARGPVARTTLGVVLVSDIVIVVLFSATLAFARTVAPPAVGAAPPGVATLLWELGGAPVVGAALGGAVALYLRFVGRELVFFALLVVFFGLELTRLLHVETLLTLLVAGFVAENTSPLGGDLRRAMERSAAPLFVVFFALSGAGVDLRNLWSVLPVVVPLALVRGLAIGAGVTLGARWARFPPAEARSVAFGLVSQAGVALGLAAILVEAYPLRATSLGALLLALIAVNETVGPILFRRALVRSGEAPRPGAAEPAPPPGTTTPPGRARTPSSPP